MFFYDYFFEFCVPIFLSSLHEYNNIQGGFSKYGISLPLTIFYAYKIKKAYQENRHEAVIKHYSKYKLLIIDEIGYLPIEREYSNIFFQLITARYENKSTIITTNQPLSKWGEVFGDPTIATTIIDRLVHHSTVIKITGRSYRIKDLVMDEGIETND